MDSTKLFNMDQDLTLGIVLSYFKLMELCQLFKVQTDGIGLKEEFRETIGKHGKNGQ